MASIDTFHSRATLDVDGRSYEIYRLNVVDGLERLPYSLKVLAENMLRTEDGANVTADHVRALAAWDPMAEPDTEIQFTPARVIMQDFTGVPCIVDLATMREAVADSARGLVVPRFMIRVDGGLFTDDEAWKPLDREDLLADFRLSKYGIKDVKIDPDTFSEAREVDLASDSDEYRIRWLEDDVRKNMAMLFANMSDGGKRESLKALVLQAMSSQFKNTFGSAQLTGYIARVVDDMDSPVVDACLHSVGGVARAVADAVSGLADDFCEESFGKLLSRGDVRLEPEYRFPESFMQANPLTSYDGALYEAEDGRVDGLERRMVDLLANNRRVRWWHRVVERKQGEFSINGFINHYPDFLALLDNGTLVAIETKGEHLAGDAARKLRLSTRWADMAGAGFRYFMVFEREAPDADNAFTLAEFGSEILG